MRFLIGLVLFSFLTTYSHSAIFMLGLGNCPEIKGAVSDFDITRYLGTWFEQYRYFIMPEVGNVCTRVNISHSEDGSIGYDISFYNTWTEDYDIVSGTAKIEGPEGAGKFVLEFPKNEISLNDASSISYRVVDTDYESYTVITSCDNKNGYYSRNVWVFTRDQYPSVETMKKALNAVKKKNLSIKFLHKIDHSNCTDTEIEVNPDAEYLDDVDLETGAEEIKL